MPDWSKLVREKLICEKIESRGLPPAQFDDVIRELAAHLEECYTQACSEGLAGDAALQQTLQQVENWHVLAAEIRRAKPQEDEDNMNHRTKNIWLPGIATSFGAGLVLLFLDRAFILQQLMFTAGLALLFSAIAEESSRFSQRTRNFWLPGFISMTATTLFLFAADFVYGPHDPSYFFTKISLDPLDLLRLHSGPARTFYFTWLLAQILSGALGAFFSRRAGGTRPARIAAGAFSATMMFGLCALAVPITYLIERKAAGLPAQAPSPLGILVWGVAPAITMLLGAGPFLKEHKPREGVTV